MRDHADTADEGARSEPAAGIAQAAGVYAVAVGALTMIGWAANLPRLTAWKNDGIAMFPNTAACAMLAGLALLLTGSALHALTYPGALQQSE